MRKTPKERLPIARKRFDLPSIVALVGLFALVAAVHFYEPLDHDYYYIIGIVLFFLPFGFQIYLNRRTKKGEGPGNLAQFCRLLFFAPLLVAAIVGVNGGFDHSLPEQRSSIVTRKWVSGGRSSNTYVIECSSWRKTTVEKLDVDRQTFRMLHAGQPITIEVHRGALGITWIGAVRAAEPVSSSS